MLFIENTIKVFKIDYEIYEFTNGYYGICLKNSFGKNPIFAGDSAWEDSYDKKIIHK
jgi:hypothetical protein